LDEDILDRTQSYSRSISQSTQWCQFVNLTKIHPHSAFIWFKKAKDADVIGMVVGTLGVGKVISFGNYLVSQKTNYSCGKKALHVHDGQTQCGENGKFYGN
ncbi:18470_t:CDS:2, partial [Gigaspora rosea]